MIFSSFNEWVSRNDSKVTILFPGGFKPTHIGHIQLVKRYLDNPKTKEVKVLIGAGIRNGITTKEAIQIAKLLFQDYKNVIIEPSKYPSPILTAYEYMKTAKPGTYAMAAVKKGKDNEDYKRVLKFVRDLNPGGKYYDTLPHNVNVVEFPVETTPIYYEGRTDEYENAPISASILRKDIMNNDYPNFKTNYPGYDDTVIRKIWLIVKMVIKENTYR